MLQVCLQKKRPPWPKQTVLRKEPSLRRVSPCSVYCCSSWSGSTPPCSSTGWENLTNNQQFQWDEAGTTFPRTQERAAFPEWEESLHGHAQPGCGMLLTPSGSCILQTGTGSVTGGEDTSMLSPWLGHGLLGTPASSGTRLWREGFKSLGHHALVARPAERLAMWGRATLATWFCRVVNGMRGEGGAPRRVVAPCLAQRCLPRITSPGRRCAPSSPASQPHPPLQTATLFYSKSLCMPDK